MKFKAIYLIEVATVIEAPEDSVPKELEEATMKAIWHGDIVPADIVASNESKVSVTVGELNV